ncbi:MAG TPA: hypothetical protein VJH69_01880 [Candidatus Paceibacterota bacterium]
MLSVFPSILFLAPFSAFIIRIALAIVLTNGAWKHFTANTREETPVNGNILLGFAILETVAAAAILVGLYAQLAALAAGILIIIWLSAARLRPIEKSTAILSLVLCLSLLLTGAGPFAFDLPL